VTNPDLAFLRRMLATRVRPEAPTPQCVGDDVLAAMAAGTLDAAERAQVLPHIAGCTHCRGAVASVARALADRAVAREVRAASAGRWSRVLRVAVPAAAAAAVLLLVWPRPTDDVTHRAPPITAVPAPVPMSPVGVVAEVERLRWGSVPGADRYRVTLFDEAGRVLYEAEVGDTAAALPDSLILRSGARYLWKVEARVGFDRWAASGLVEFSVARSGGDPR
jgi:putative zinc finger protein